MAERDEGFISRWSRLKSAEAKRREEPPVDEPAPVAEAAEQHPAEAPEEVATPSELPPIDSLTKDSDYTAFLRQGVPPELRRDALRTLWRSDPVFANLDGLLEYGEDYGAKFRTPGVVATIYRVGKGMVDASVGESEEQEKLADDAAATATETKTDSPTDTADAKEADDTDGSDEASASKPERS